MRIRQSELQRACNGWTVIVRPQARGGVMVTTVHVFDGRIWQSRVVKHGDVQREIREQLRMMHKCGFCLPMADRSRHRCGEKITARKGRLSHETADVPPDAPAPPAEAGGA